MASAGFLVYKGWRRILWKVAALLVLLSLPALADSITPPVMSVAFSGVSVTGFFNSPTNYYLTGTDPCSATCAGFEVQNGVFTGRSTINFAAVSFSNGSAVAGEMFGHLGRVSFNAQTDVLSGIFGGKEQMETLINGKWFPESWYVVRGTFSENLGTGSGSLNLNSSTYIGSTAVPEPSTWALILSGLAAIGMVKRRSAKSTSQTT